MLKFQGSRATLLTVVLLSSLFVADAGFAKPNNGSFNRSSEGFKRVAADCKHYKQELDRNEKEADKRAGTKAAKPYADAADTYWEAGAALGCSWAQ